MVNPKIIRLENKNIGPGQPVLVIAEAGVNHEGKVSTAKKLIDAAVKAKADIVKFQTFSADRIVIKKAEMAAYQQENLQSNQSQYALLKALEIDGKAHEDLHDYCKRHNIIFQSTAHSNRWSVDLLEHLGVTSHKIGSGDLTNIPHIKYTAATGKVVFLSTGMGIMDEVHEAVDAFRSTGNQNLILFHCTTNYPCPQDEVNLKAMKTMMNEFPELIIGYSDHTLGLLVPFLAAYHGAHVIEKHYTLSRSIHDPKSPDHKASLEPQELKDMVAGIHYIRSHHHPTFTSAIDGLQRDLGIDISHEYAAGLEQTVSIILGDGIKKPNPSETKIGKVARKSIICIKPVKKGERFTDENIDILRPEGGLHPREWDRLLLKGYATKDISPEEYITTEAVSYR